MPMRNPFRRQTETPAPSLRERAADLSSRLANTIRKPEVAEDVSFPTPPTNLAEACLWAIKHRAWIDGELKASDWSDERFDAESAKTNAVFTRAINEPSANLREITAKAALALEDFERFTLLPGRKLDDGTRIVHTVLREIVGVGREAGASAALTLSSDLSAAILDGWAAWGATPDSDNDGAQDKKDAPRTALIDAAMELPATPENITTKALACAWIEWVQAERLGQPRDAYGPGDQLVYDINATIMARGAQGDAATARRPVELPLSILVPTVDFTGASMSELRAIREAADLVCSVASAATWQGSNRLPDAPSGGARHNRAGELMEWVSDALCHVVSAAEREAWWRTPESRDDQETRLAMLAGSIIGNDDPAEIAALARELLAMVEP